MKSKLILLVTCIVFFGFISSTLKIKTGEDVIRAMYNKYNGKWYKYFTFTQDGIFYKDGKEFKTEVWHEAASFPGKLIIKFHNVDGKDGVVFSNKKVCSIRDGVASPERPFIHDLLLVGFDVYFLEPKVSIHILDSLGYNLKLVRKDVFEGREVYVVGTNKKDETVNQFWIDIERLYMHRIITNKNNHISDVIFGDYELIENNWVAKKVTFKNNGSLEMEEKYNNIKFPSVLNDTIFESKNFSKVKW